MTEIYISNTLDNKLSDFGSDGGTSIAVKLWGKS